MKCRRLIYSAAAGAALVVAAGAMLTLSGLSDRLAPADVALVPGNTVLPDGQPSPRLRARLDRAVELYKKLYFPTIIVSGGVGKEGWDEADAMANYLVAHDVPREAIVTDHDGVTTYASARFTAAYLPDPARAKVLVISQYFHLPRARLALRRFGIGTVYSAHARYFELRDLYSIPRELVGWCSYALRRYPKPTAPPVPPAGGR